MQPAEEDRKPASLPDSVVAVHRRNHSNTDDNRSISSPKSESGYHSSEALSDAAAYAPTSSLRSVGSVGSQGSGGHDAMYAGAAFTAETTYTFAMASYATSEAGKSDIATVCSGSVIEDIEVSSLDLNVVPSSHSERGVMMAGSNLRRSVEFAPSSFTPFHKHVATEDMTKLNADQSAARWNDMGPPLSRALLMQRLQSTTGSTTGSRAGSVKSYGSNTGASQNSDVGAHVDTDDCGGSLMGSITDCQSLHSQEDVRSGTEAEPHEPEPASKEEEKEPSNGTHPFLKNCAPGEHSNGRTSPGGTIYKGKGVRRYQGRYMNLPLQRFRQDAGDDLPATVLEADKVMEEKNRRSPPERNGGYGDRYDDDWRRSRSPMRNGQEGRYRGRGRSPSPARNNSYHESSNGYHNNNNGYSSNRRPRSRSRSNSPERNRRRRWNRGDNSPRNNRRSRHDGRNSGSASKSPTSGGQSPRRRSRGRS